MDLVLVDKEGRVFIVDIKTGRESKWKNYKNTNFWVCRGINEVITLHNQINKLPRTE
jgi:hypothetical protein